MIITLKRKDNCPRLTPSWALPLWASPPPVSGTLPGLAVGIPGQGDRMQTPCAMTSLCGQPHQSHWPLTSLSSLITSFSFCVVGRAIYHFKPCNEDLKRIALWQIAPREAPPKEKTTPILHPHSSHPPWFLLFSSLEGSPGETTQQH